MKKKAIMWTALRCLIVFTIVTNAVPITVFALNDNTYNPHFNIPDFLRLIK